MKIFYRLQQLPRDIWLYCVRFYQRGRYGISIQDTWHLDFYLTDIIIQGIKTLKNSQIGYIICLPEDINKKWSQELEDRNTKEWCRILDEIIWTFETNQKIINLDWVGLQEEYSEELANKLINLVYTHVMTKEECERYKQGWKYFQKYFNALWD
jgi:hypothetical protein